MFSERYMLRPVIQVTSKLYASMSDYEYEELSLMDVTLCC